MLVPKEGCCKDSLLWDSEKEYNDWLELKKLEKLGKARHLKRQVKFVFQVVYGSMSDPGTEIYVDKMVYVADFTYYDEHGFYIVRDSKGYKTRAYKKKKMLMKKIYGIEIKES